MFHVKKIKKGLLRDEFYQYSDSHVNAIVNGQKEKRKEKEKEIRSVLEILFFK